MTRITITHFEMDISQCPHYNECKTVLMTQCNEGNVYGLVSVQPLLILLIKYGCIYRHLNTNGVYPIVFIVWLVVIVNQFIKYVAQYTYNRSVQPTDYMILGIPFT